MTEGHGSEGHDIGGHHSSSCRRRHGGHCLYHEIHWKSGVVRKGVMFKASFQAILLMEVVYVAMIKF